MAQELAQLGPIARGWRASDCHRSACPRRRIRAPSNPCRADRTTARADSGRPRGGRASGSALLVSARAAISARITLVLLEYSNRSPGSASSGLRGGVIRHVVAPVEETASAPRPIRRAPPPLRCASGPELHLEELAQRDFARADRPAAASAGRARARRARAAPSETSSPMRSAVTVFAIDQLTKRVSGA